MPIVRTYQCADCFHRIEVTLDSSQWDDPPPSCPECDRRDRQTRDYASPLKRDGMQQEFQPVAIGGSNRVRAVAIAEKIAAEDYGVADMNPVAKEGEPVKHRLKDDKTFIPSRWEGNAALLQTAMATGRQTRLQHGDGLDVLKSALKSGAQPDLIEASKRRAMRVW